MTNLNNTAPGRVSESDLDRLQNERAAFGGASSLPTPEQIAQQPWRYPQGRLPESHPARITPPEDDDWNGPPLTWFERLMVFALWAASFAAAVSVLRAVLS